MMTADRAPLNEAISNADWLSQEVGWEAFHPIADLEDTIASPPLILTKSHADEVLAVFDLALTRTPR